MAEWRSMKATQDLDRSARQIVLERIFVAQIGIVVVLTILALAVKFSWWDFGAFWPGFCLGGLGGSVGMLRRVRAGNQAAIEEAAPSWIATLMPILFGALMAGVSYLLFTSRLLSGYGDQGLFTSNLFPKFTDPPEPFTLHGWYDTKLVEGTDLGKLLIWCFIAGYSEKFVTGILQQLERNPGQASEK